jgi:hypothetical protein
MLRLGMLQERDQAIRRLLGAHVRKGQSRCVPHAGGSGPVKRTHRARDTLGSRRPKPLDPAQDFDRRLVVVGR